MGTFDSFFYVDVSVVFITDHTDTFKVELKVNIQLEAIMQNKVVTLTWPLSENKGGQIWLNW